jgi:hypothetical protein
LSSRTDFNGHSSAYTHNNMNRLLSRTRFVFIHLRPFLRLCVCLTITFAGLESGLHYLIPIDFPVSIVGVAMMFRYGNHQIYYHPLLWFGTLGTLWWYFQSRVAEYVLNKFRPRNDPREKVSPSV